MWYVSSPTKLILCKTQNEAVQVAGQLSEAIVIRACKDGDEWKPAGLPHRAATQAAKRLQRAAGIPDYR